MEYRISSGLGSKILSYKRTCPTFFFVLADLTQTIERKENIGMWNPFTIVLFVYEVLRPEGLTIVGGIVVAILVAAAIF